MAAQSRAGALPAVLLTRPQAQGDRLAGQLRARLGPGLRIVTSPLMAPVFPDVALPPGDWAGYVLTSETGVQALRRLGLPLRPAWCVGDRTAQAAREAGLPATSAAGDAAALVAAILAAGPQGPLLHLRGREARGQIAARLTAAGQPAAEALVYAQEPRPLSAAAADLLAGAAPVAIPVFSPRTAALLAADPAARGGRAPLWLAAISPAAAEPLAALRPDRLKIALRPDAASMLAALDDLIADGGKP